MDQSFKESGEENKAIVYATSGISLSLAAGVVSYLFKAGSLMSSFLSTVPIWKGFDPVAIMMGPKKKKKKNDEKTIEENRYPSDTTTDQKAENMFSERENQ